MPNFSENIVNQRFKLIYNLLEKGNYIKGKSDIAQQLGTYNHVINNILKGERNLTLAQIQQLCTHFGIDSNYLFGFNNNPFREDATINGESIPQASKRSLNSGGGRRNIKLVPIQALAGYAIEQQTAEPSEEYPSFSIPDLEGELLAFAISGDSMLPTITNGDIIVCEPLDRPLDGSFPSLKDNQVYVFITDVVVVKRVQQIRKGGKIQHLRLISDNSAVYQPYTIDLSEIQRVLRVKCRLTDYAIS
jgi:hypothetical protein